jgi:hypothetical protein
LMPSAPPVDIDEQDCSRTIQQSHMMTISDRVSRLLGLQMLSPVPSAPPISLSQSTDIHFSISNCTTCTCQSERSPNHVELSPVRREHHVREHQDGRSSDFQPPNCCEHRHFSPLNDPLLRTIPCSRLHLHRTKHKVVAQ